MKHSVVCYAQRDKLKSQRLLEAFAAGCGGRMAWATERKLLPGAVVFYGVRAPWLHLWQQAKAECRDVFYIDNAYFDCSREQQFRVTKNAIQHNGRGESDGQRLKALGVTVKPWRGGGEYTLVCAQSDEFMAVVAEDARWLKRTTAELRLPFVVRRKETRRPFAEDLANARVVVTWSSAAAVNALCEGVPVVCSDRCAAYRVGNRQKWAEVLADNQFTVAEFANGDAWRCLHSG